MPLVTCTLTPDLERQEETRQRPRSLSGQSAERSVHGSASHRHY